MFRLKSQASLAKQYEEFVFVRTLGVVLRLMLDVVPKDVQMGGVHAEGTVALLPGKTDAILADPTGRVA
jgi:hypothetical protein